MPLRNVSHLLSVLRSQNVPRYLQNGVPRDALLFRHERGRFFAILGLFCAGQGIFWTSLAVAALSRPLSRVPAEAPNRSYQDLRSALWRYGLAVGCGTMGKRLGSRLLWGCEHNAHLAKRGFQKSKWDTRYGCGVIKSLNALHPHPAYSRPRSAPHTSHEQVFEATNAFSPFNNRAGYL